MTKKYIDIKEFREKGYLQELNRCFLHPLGLALEIKINEDGTEEINGIWDCREDEEGVYFDLANSDMDRKEKFHKNAINIAMEKHRKKSKRLKLFGSEIEPVIVDVSDKISVIQQEDVPADIAKIISKDFWELV